MQHYQNPVRSVLLSLALFATPALANDCGDIPTAPEVVDGASATMDDLVANSESVKTFIADADAYLDCNESFVKSKQFKDLEATDQKAALDANSRLLKARNDIGVRFNEEVAAYKAANPE